VLTRRVLLPLAAVVLLVVAVVGYSFYREGQMYVSTDNAQLTGQPIQVGSMNAGQVQAVVPSIGSTVHKGDVLAQVALPSQIGTAQNGAAKMGFLGAGDTRVDVTAPVDGLVIATPMGVGATVQPGQPIVTLIDPSQMWVTANIEETSIGRVRVGQPVTVHVDALSTDVPGKVEAITPATASNASGNFNKVTQLVPVRISVNLGNELALLGTSVEVKVKVAD
jgi:multidrug resistance efflux pump